MYTIRGDGWDPEPSGYSEDGEPQVAIDAPEDSHARECPDCGAYIEEDAEAITATADDPELTVVHVDGHEDDCGQKEWFAEETIAFHFNGAGVIVREDHTRSEVQVWISVGDPRGAFCMTLELVKVGQYAGDLRLSVPYPGESLPHMELSKMGSEGYFKVSA